MDEGIRAGLTGLDPSTRRKVLRDFGLGLAVILWIFAAFAWRKGSPKAAWELGVGIASAAAALTVPGVFAPVYSAWMPVAILLGRLNTRIILALLYYLFITPYAFCARLFGMRMLDERMRDGESYWRVKEPGAGLKSYERQF